MEFKVEIKDITTAHHDMSFHHQTTNAIIPSRSSEYPKSDRQDGHLVIFGTIWNFDADSMAEWWAIRGR
jgi:hypothetical protein